MGYPIEILDNEISKIISEIHSRQELINSYTKSITAMSNEITNLVLRKNEIEEGRDKLKDIFMPPLKRMVRS